MVRGFVTAFAMTIGLAWMGGLDRLSAQPPAETQPSASEASLTAEQVAFFESKIRPVLVKECYGCHSNKAGNVRGGLRLDTQQLMQLGGSSGPAVVPGSPADSLLMDALNHDGFEMPPNRKLSRAVIDDFQQWIEMGAPDPRQTAVAEIKSTITAQDIANAKQNFWAYQPPRRIPPAAPPDDRWAKTEIDRYVLAGLHSADLQPAPDAAAHKVLRRLCFDLVGLPPTPEQVASFEQLWQRDPEAAVERVIDALLDKPQFGERWGRHWLDVVRYAESTGREVNMTYPHAWRYRDFVIDSFNDDKPFDHFVQQQIAGDLMPAEDDAQWSENLVATTFLAMGPKNVNEQNRVQFEADLVDEQIDATTRVFLGMSVACARCHDHKFDAFRQQDYYALAGIFSNMTTYFGNPPSEFGALSGVQTRRNSSLLLLPVQDPNPYDKRYSTSELQQLRDEITQVRQQLVSLRPGGGQQSNQNAIRNRLQLVNRLADLSAKIAVVDANGEPLSYCMGVQESTQPGNARVLVRGEIDQPGPVVQRGFPEVMCEQPVTIDPGSSGRLELARWIGGQDHPLTARVMVNRIWQHLIGRGLVASTENFGVTGQAPSHPELLDYLAIRFVDSGWSVKTLVKEIASSRVYRMASAFDEVSHQRDPDNELLWRAHPRRLDAEAIRDAMLQISGQLDLSRPRGSEVAKAGYTRVRDGVLGDPRQQIRQAMERARRDAMGANRQAFNNGRQRFTRRNFGDQRQRESMQRAMQDSLRQIADQYSNPLDMEDARMRSVYLPVVRDHEPRSLAVFDFADSSSIIGTREVSNTANQALYLMNNDFVLQQSEAFARRLADQPGSLREKLETAFVMVYARPPSADERQATAAFLRQFQASSGNAPDETLVAFCQSLFAAAEFRYID